VGSAIKVNLSASVLGVDDTVACADTRGTAADNVALSRLLLSRGGEKDTAGGLLFRLNGLDQYTIAHRGYSLDLIRRREKVILIKCRSVRGN
jgi:hypothetical protein